MGVCEPSGVPLRSIDNILEVSVVLSSCSIVCGLFVGCLWVVCGLFGDCLGIARELFGEYM